jgi:phytase-like protein
MSRRCVFVVMLFQAAAGGCQLADEPLGQTSANLGEAGAEAGADAAIDLIAIGSITGGRADRSHATSAALENGVAGNLLGGVGSGIAYAGGHIFLAVPDRGPNAVAYNTATDDTTSYIDRVQTFFMRLEHSAPGSALPFDLEPILLDTTLLHSARPLHYGAGTDVALAGGAPALNAARGTHYFTGRSDNFDPAMLSTDADDARLDPEGIRVSPDGRRGFLSDEYGPHVYEFDRWTGARVRSFALPTELAVPIQSPQPQPVLRVRGRPVAAAGSRATARPRPLTVGSAARPAGRAVTRSS